VKHFDEEYVRHEADKTVTTNTIEGYFGLLKSVTGRDFLPHSRSLFSN